MAGRYQSQPFMGQQSGQQFQSQGEQWQPQGQQWQSPDTSQSLQSRHSVDGEEKERQEVKPKVLKYKVCGMREKIAWRVFWVLLSISAALALASLLVHISQTSDSSDGDQTNAAPITREVTLPEASAVTSAAALNSACSVNPSMYHQSQECLTSLPFWQDTTKFSAMAGGCFIDPNTGVMNCTRRDSCGGGSLRPGTKPGKLFVYPCGDKCSNDASLFSSCCNVCATQRKLELADGQYGVECQGCNSSIEAMPAPDCTFENGTFNCAVQAECQTGEPLSYSTPQSCNVLPCDECSEGIMRATCCAKCLEHKCAFGSSSRTVCQGCDLPMSSTTSQLLLVTDRSFKETTEGKDSPLAWWLGLVSIIALVAALILLAMLCCKPKVGDTKPKTPKTASRRGVALEADSRESSEQAPMLSTKWRSTIVGPSGEVLEATNWSEGEPPEQVQNVIHVPHSLQPPVSSLASPPSMLQAQQPVMPPTSMFQQQPQTHQAFGQQPYMQYTSGQMAYAPQASGQQTYMPQAFGQQPHMNSNPSRPF